MKAIIVDDVTIARRGIRLLADRHDDLEIIGSFGSAVEALEFIKPNDVELIFLDIEMPEVSGLELAAALPRPIPVIFTTAYSEHAVEGFALDAIDYLVKPIDSGRFDRAIAKARRWHSYKNLRLQQRASTPDNEEVLTIKHDRRYLRIRFENILYIEGNKDFVTFHLSDSRISCRSTIKAISERLPAQIFIRVNKSFIVNRRKIDSFDNNDIYIGRREIAIGPTYREEVLASLLGS